MSTSDTDFYKIYYFKFQTFRNVFGTSHTASNLYTSYFILGQQIRKKNSDTLHLRRQKKDSLIRDIY